MAESNYETYRRGRQHFDLGDPIGAARVLAPLAEEEPRNRTVLELLGRSYFHSAQLAKAEEVFRKIIELDPCDAWAHIALARTLARQTRADGAAPHRRVHAIMSGGSRDSPPVPDSLGRAGPRLARPSTAGRSRVETRGVEFAGRLGDERAAWCH